MQKHYVAILDSVPHCFHGGGGITAYAAVRAMRAQGNRVSVLALSSGVYDEKGTVDKYKKHLEDLGISVHILEKNAYQSVRRGGIFATLFPSIGDILPGFFQRDAVRKYCALQKPDAVFLYHWNALAAAYRIHIAPKLGIVGDPLHLPQLFRRAFLTRYSERTSLLTIVKTKIIDVVQIPRFVRIMRRLLLDCSASGAFAAHHAQMLRDVGVHHCQYFRTPTPDPLIAQPKIAKAKKFTILHIGHLQGTATLSGIELLANEIIPSLINALPPDSFEVHIVGKYFETLPEKLKKKLLQPCVKIIGFIPNIDEEFLSSHIVIVPIPIELGIRVRILTAFSYGSCVVTHRANILGIPELEHRKNALIGKNGRDLADLCVEVFHDASLREQIERVARQTYEQYFSMHSAGDIIVQNLDRICTGKS